jgi:hypothetical protein
MKTETFWATFTVGMSIALSLTPACTTPTLQQRQDTWSQYRDSVRATCVVGKNDPAMPADVKTWCAKAVAP